MENPRLRYIEPVPFVQGGRELILLRDSEGIVENSLVVSREVAFILSLMDGTRTLRDIHSACSDTFGRAISLDQIKELVDTMDTHFFLMNQNFFNHFRKIRDDYELSPLREARLAGSGYPRNRMDLLTFLDDLFEKSTGGDFKPPIPGKITGILAPHIDYKRGLAQYRKAYGYLRNTEVSPLVIVFGTSHRYMEKLWGISLKDFSTPLDTIPTSKDLAGAIRNHRILKNYINEWPHRAEHSIELQLPLLQFVIQHDFELLPVLTGSMQEYIEGTKGLDDPEISDIVGSFQEVLDEYGRPYIIISGADLAHIGAQFGDQYRLSPTILAESKEQDLSMIEEIRKLDADGFFRFISAEHDSRRICGLSPIYFQLKLLSGNTCTVTGYDQWTDGNSSVSFAGCVFSRPE